MNDTTRVGQNFVLHECRELNFKISEIALGCTFLILLLERSFHLKPIFYYWTIFNLSQLRCREENFEISEFSLGCTFLVVLLERPFYLELIFHCRTLFNLTHLSNSFKQINT